MHPFMLDALARDRMQSRSRAAARLRRPNRFAALFARFFGRITVPTALPAPTPRPALLPVPVEVGWARGARDRRVARAARPAPLRPQPQRALGHAPRLARRACRRVAR